MQQRLVAIDGNSLLYRAYFAMPAFTDPMGRPCGAVLGFLNMLTRLLSDYPVTHLVVAFDVGAPTFRHETFEAYKAGRAETPDDLRAQFPILKEGLIGFGITILEQAGMEADDFLGSLAKAGDSRGIETLIVTGDQDALQLISQNTHVLMTRKGMSEIERFDTQHLLEVYGLTPAQVIDWKALMGDKSDNIPGVPGVGEKTALKLLEEFGNVDHLYQNLDKVKGKLQEKLLQNKELAYLSQNLATIHRDIPLQDLDEYAYNGIPEQGFQWLQKQAFRTLINRLSHQKSTNSEVKIEAHAPSTSSNLIPIASIDEISRHIDLLDKGERIAIDLEEDGLHIGNHSHCYFIPKSAWMTDISTELTLFDAPTQPVNHFGDVLRKCTPVFNTTKVMFWDVKAWYRLFDEFSIAFPAQFDDLMLLSYCLDCGRTATKPLQVINAFTNATTVNSHTMLQAFDEINERMTDLSQKLYQDIEMPLSKVLYKMEQNGFRVDKDELKRLGKEFEDNLQRLTKAIYALTGVEGFNLSSPKQLSQVLFEKLKLPVQRKTRTGVSTDAEALEALADQHECIPLILEYRQVQKIKSTYIDGLLLCADPVTHKVHTRFQQAVTTTGRLSSVSPNLQNIPIRTQLGKQIRKVFVPSYPSWRLVDADYSQIELRLLAHISGDPSFINAFVSGEDIHRRTASEVFGVPLDLVTQEMRSAAKAVNFGIVYGISDFGLSRQIGVNRKSAAEYIERYFERYPGIRDYMSKTITDAHEKGGASTMFGRWRSILELKASSYNMRQFGERAAINTPIQGTAADIMKLAMIAVDKALSGMQAKMILQVHDELVIECPAYEVDEVKKICKNQMSQVVSLHVPLEVDIAVGSNWFESK